ncbi:imidazole glycerol phosphate synthase subunit HisF [Oceaniserpentilla sp. 4NH20-0058]|uniref:imidazole glycerol phosphate synthase subunit HisF n=1 Tax=Oceaniserpentilla sp. 4NH20-0058 TaxID=3127660 RepID=UPI003109FF7F
MLKKRIIPILLLKGNAVVKTVNFEDPRMVGDAITNVKVFSTRKADEMVIVDIEATKRGSINFALLKRLSAQCVMPLTLGGGIKTLSDADQLFKVGADKVVINSEFYLNPDLLTQISQKYGQQAVVFSLDIVKQGEDYIAVSCGKSIKHEGCVVEIAKKAVEYGAGEIIVNSVDCDGKMQGYDTELCDRITKHIHVPVILAGGCGSKEDCVSAIEHHASAIAAGSIFYWVGESILTIKEYMHKQGIEVRLL